MSQTAFPRLCTSLKANNKNTGIMTIKLERKQLKSCFYQKIRKDGSIID